ncbi:hypothetical protein LJB85_04075 [Porphyromonadaceae bacterium OttesenSCG-928-L07]|nr:hypothetical protein [Porphyromonadaceae bacterium OttesenSCG-928-L07]MDL2251394.1 hypothetical protein [Odoribacter sp. OttesenSCG-928-J03]MDL2330621.1 hypothetical protein [Odoribacter sp. OttesenSCG-928-A06]
MKNNLLKIGITSLILIVTFSGCNDKYISHQCAVGLNFDWTMSIHPGNKNKVEMTLFGPDGSCTHSTTDPDEIFLEDLPDGTYHVLVTENTEHITFDDYVVSVDVDPEGNVLEPSTPFSAGEKELVVQDMEIVGDDHTINMIQQSRILIVRFWIMNNNQKFASLDEFSAVLTNVTVKRDISMGFPPTAPAHSVVQASEYKDFNMSFTKTTPETGSGAFFAFESQQRLLGLDPAKPHIFTFSYEGDLLSPFLIFDPSQEDSGALSDFHTLMNINDPYIFTIKITADVVNGAFTIVGWDVESNEEEMTANEM